MDRGMIIDENRRRPVFNTINTIQRTTMSKVDNGSQDSFIVEEVLQCLRNIAYGEIIITIHDSKVVQIEKREKKRFSQTKHSDCAGRAQQEQ